MRYGQLYYTSCENGLSGYGGFQFNAVTQGIPVEVMREVEALTAYEPPRWLGYQPSAEQIADCPVNLVYSTGRTSVLANVVFVGSDFSKRFGNYFVHALVTDEADGFGGRLPI